MLYTLCWDCKMSTDMSCSWSSDFEPVPGWEAEPEKLKIGDGRSESYSDSFNVTACPLFLRDAYGGGMYRLSEKKKYEEKRRM